MTGKYYIVRISPESEFGTAEFSVCLVSLGLEAESRIEIKGEREWWDAFQQRNPGIFEGCPIRFQDAPVPPEVSSSPRVRILDQKKPNSVHREGIISSHPPKLLPSAGIVNGGTASNLLQSVKNAIGKTAPHMVDSVARRVFRLLNSVNRLSPRSQRNSGGI
ncbi:hypothetical protein Ancab_004718 [Ancistrocladus abbreviatus]